MCDIFAEKVDADGGLDRMWGYIIFFFELVVDKAIDEAGFAGAGISKEDNFIGSFSERWGGDWH